MRSLFYSWMVYAEDQETQRNGMVAVTYTVGTKNKRTQNDKGNMWVSLPRVMRAVPLRGEGRHQCYDDRVWETLFSFYKISLNQANRMRMRAHYGEFIAILALLVIINPQKLTIVRFRITS